MVGFCFADESEAKLFEQIIYKKREIYASQTSSSNVPPHTCIILFYFSLVSFILFFIAPAKTKEKEKEKEINSQKASIEKERISGPLEVK